jgi:hypothetical protein
MNARYKTQKRNLKKRDRRKSLRLKTLENGRLKETERINNILPETVEGNSVLSIRMLQDWDKIPEYRKTIPVDFQENYFSYLCNFLF